MDVIDVDWNDPCATAKALREARLRLISGGLPQRISHTSSETTRDITYSAPNLDALENEIARAEAECAALTGGTITPRNRRYAMTAGSRRPGWGWP